MLLCYMIDIAAGLSFLCQNMFPNNGQPILAHDGRWSHWPICLALGKEKNCKKFSSALFALFASS